MDYIKKFFSALYYAIFVEGDTLAQNKKDGDETSPNNETQNETSGE